MVFYSIVMNYLIVIIIIACCTIMLLMFNNVLFASWSRAIGDHQLGVIISIYQMIIIFLLPLILMSSSYYKVMKVLWRSTKNMSALTNTRLSDQSNNLEPTFVLSPYEPRPFTIRQQSLLSRNWKIQKFFCFRTYFRQLGGGRLIQFKGLTRAKKIDWHQALTFWPV